MENRESRRLDFRNAMARMSAAVTIVTSNGESGRCGVTATAVCSVTDTPPTLLVCLNRSSAMNPVFKANGRLCVNLLTGEQEALARDFAGLTGVPMQERFAGGQWSDSPLGLPVLQGALATLEGHIVRADDLGSHTIMIVEIDEIGLHPDGADSLVYFDRLFHRVSAAKQTADHH